MKASLRLLLLALIALVMGSAAIAQPPQVHVPDAEQEVIQRRFLEIEATQLLEPDDGEAGV